MKRLLRLAAAVLAIGGMVLVVVGVLLARRLDTPEFRKELLGRVKTALGTDVRVRRMELSLLSGVDLEGVGIANPAPFSGDLLTADAFVFRYRLMPLLLGRIAVDRLSLRRPVLTLVMDSRGGYNFERLASPSPPSPGVPRGTSLPFAIELSRLSVEGGRLSVTDARKVTLLAVDGMDLASSLRVPVGGAEGRGDAAIARVVLGSGVAVTEIRAPLQVTAGIATIAPLRARLAGGDVAGQLRLNAARARFTAEIELRGVDVKALAQEAHSAAGFGGSLGAKASVEGSGGVATLKGRGSAQIDRCRVEESKLFGLIATALQVPGLNHPDLDECRVEFTLGSGHLQTPVFRAKGPMLALTGKGTVDLVTSGLDYQMTLALASQLLDRLPVQELRAAFRDRGDGVGALDFNVSGTTTDPKTDLAARLGKAAVGSKVQKLFKKIL